MLLEIWWLGCRRKARGGDSSIYGGVVWWGWLSPHLERGGGVAPQPPSTRLPPMTLCHFWTKRQEREERDISVIRSARRGVPFELVLNPNSSEFEASRAKLRRFQCKASAAAQAHPPTENHLQLIITNTKEASSHAQHIC